MKTINITIICVTIFLLVGGLIFAIWSENVLENPYEQCLQGCSKSYAMAYECTKTCNEDFKEAIEIIADRFIPLVEEIIKQDALTRVDE